MLSHGEKINILKSYLTETNHSYADSFKTDILIYFDEFKNPEENTLDLKFLNNLNTKKEIHNYIDKLTSKIVMKYNEEEEQLSDFIFYTLNQ